MNHELFDIDNPRFIQNPYPFYARLRREKPLYYHAPWDIWLFSKYQDIDKLITDDRLGRTMDHILTDEEVTERRLHNQWHRMPNYSRYVRINLLETEGADHGRLRELIYQAFTPIRIENLRIRIQHLANELLDTVAAKGNMDFLEEYAAPLPVFVIADLLGVPVEDRHHLRPWSHDIVQLYELNHSNEDAERAEQTARLFAEYLQALVEKRRTNPEDDLITALITAEKDGDKLTDDELIATCMMILNAGHESTVNAAGNGMLALFRHPEQLKKLKDKPLLVNTAVEEMLRYDSPLQFFHRWVLQDMQYKDHFFKKGSKIAFLYGSANRDAEVFDDPETLDITRAQNRHFAFGRGNHFCMGAPLARLELQIMFNTLLQRFPDINLTIDEPSYRKGFTFRGLQSLPIKFL